MALVPPAAPTTPITPAAEQEEAEGWTEVSSQKTQRAKKNQAPPPAPAEHRRSSRFRAKTPPEATAQPILSPHEAPTDLYELSTVSLLLATDAPPSNDQITGRPIRRARVQTSEFMDTLAQQHAAAASARTSANGFFDSDGFSESDDNSISGDSDVFQPQSQGHLAGRRTSEPSLKETRCPIPNCSRSFIGNEGLQRHLSTYHLQYEGVVPEPWIRCNHGCGRFFRTMGGLKHHNTCHHHGTEPYVRAAQDDHESEDNGQHRDTVTPTSGRRRVRGTTHTDGQERRLIASTQPNRPSTSSGSQRHHTRAATNGERRATNQHPTAPTVTHDQLLNFYASGDLSFTNSQWLPLIRTLTMEFMGLMVSDNHDTAARSAVALFTLPGLLEFIRVQRAQNAASAHQACRPIIEVLRGVVEAPNRVNAVIGLAESLFTHAAANPGPRRQQGVKDKDELILRLTAQVANACKKGRISIAAGRLAEISELLLQDEQYITQRALITPTETATLISSLFPEASVADNLEEPDWTTAALTLSAEQVLATLCHLKTDSAHGASGWTNSLLRKITMRGVRAEQMAMAARVAAVYNLILSGKACDELREVWLRCRLVFIPKDPAGFRPIGISDVFNRAMGTTIMRSVGPALGNRLSPLQLAVGVSGGVEIAAVLVDLGNRPGYATMSIDMSNAYNSLRRKEAQAGILEFVPELQHLYYWTYKTRITLHGRDGTKIGDALSGLVQGLPDSTAYFAIGIQPMLIAIREELSRLQGEMKCDPAFLVAIADDISIVGPTALVIAVTRFVQHAVDEKGLQLNLNKSFIQIQEVDDTAPHPKGWTITKEGAKTLGRPIGSLQSQDAWLTRKLGSLLPSPAAFTNVSSIHGMMILRHSTNHRADYLRKVTSKDVDSDPFLSFDKELNRCIRAAIRVAEEVDAPYLQAIRDLPLRYGGINMPTLKGIDQERHRMVTFRRARAFLTTHHPSFVDELNLKYECVEGEEGYEFTTQVDKRIEDKGESLPIAAKIVANQIHLETSKHIHADLLQLPDKAMAANFLSTSTGGTSTWVSPSSLPYQNGVPFGQEEFREALRLQLAIPFSNKGPGVATNCFCGEDILNDSSHPITCSGNGAIISDRHDYIRDFLKDLIEKVLPESKPEIEPLAHVDQPFVRRPDIVFTENGAPFYIDVTVVEPTANKYTTTWQSHIVPGAAAARKAVEKHRDYKTVEDSGRQPHINLIVFSIEATGRLHEEGRDFLMRICQQHKELLKTFHFDISFVLASARGRSMAYCRKRMLRAPGGQHHNPPEEEAVPQPPEASQDARDFLHEVLPAEVQAAQIQVVDAPSSPEVTPTPSNARAQPRANRSAIEPPWHLRGETIREGDRRARRTPDRSGG